MGQGEGRKGGEGERVRGEKREGKDTREGRKGQRKKCEEGQ